MIRAERLLKRVEGMEQRRGAKEMEGKSV